MVNSRNNIRRLFWRPLLLVLLLTPRTPILATEPDSLPTFRMIATFYADKFHGRRTSSGEIFDQNKATAAHISIKLGTWVRVTNTRNDEQIIVKINDRCPKRGVIDLSRSAARKIGIRGTAPVIVEILSADSAADLLAQSQLEEMQAPAEPITDKIDTKQTPPAKASTQQKQPEKEKAKPAAKKVAKKEAKNHTPSKIDNHRYNILLCKTTTQKRARQEVEKLPLLYQENVKITPDLKHSGQLVILDMSLTKHQAREISKALQKSFPNSELIQISR